MPFWHKKSNTPKRRIAVRGVRFFKGVYTVNPIYYILLAWNLTVFALYGLDKRKAKRGQWRTPESVLLLTAFALGGIGALLGMQLFRHKTRHWKFKILVPLAAVVTVAGLAGLIYLGL